MKTKTLVLVALAAAVAYFVFLKPAAPKPATGAAAVLGDLGKLVGDFSGQHA
jgi:hypothetical protein